MQVVVMVEKLREVLLVLESEKLFQLRQLKQSEELMPKQFL
jgi:hypothetical protein